MVGPPGRPLLADSRHAAEVDVRRIRQHLRQAAVDIEGVVRAHAVDGLLEAVSQPDVREWVNFAQI